MDKLGLLTDGRLTRAGALCFYREPEKVIDGCYVKIGMFEALQSAIVEEPKVPTGTMDDTMDDTGGEPLEEKILQVLKDAPDCTYDALAKTLGVSRRTIVSGYFDFTEVQAARHRPRYMNDYVEQLMQKSHRYPQAGYFLNYVRQYGTL